MSTFKRLSTISFLFVALASSMAACSADDDNPGHQPPTPDAGPDGAIVRGTDAGSDSGDETSDAGDAGSDSDGGDGGGGGDPREKIVKACTDLGDAFAKAYARCGTLSYQEVYDIYMAQVGGPTCPNVVGIRDENELRGQCIPWFSSVSCANLGTTDPSCKEQLQVTQTVMPESLAPQRTMGKTTVPALRQLVDER